MHSYWYSQQFSYKDLKEIVKPFWWAKFANDENGGFEKVKVIAMLKVHNAFTSPYALVVSVSLLEAIAIVDISDSDDNELQTFKECNN